LGVTSELPGCFTFAVSTSPYFLHDKIPQEFTPSSDSSLRKEENKIEIEKEKEGLDL